MKINEMIYWKLTQTHTLIIKNSMAHWFGPKFKALEILFQSALPHCTDRRTGGPSERHTRLFLYIPNFVCGDLNQNHDTPSVYWICSNDLWTTWWPNLWWQAIFVWSKNLKCSSIKKWTKLHDCTNRRTNGHALNFVCGGLGQIHDTSSGLKQYLLEKT